MASLFQRLDEEEAIVRGELDALREKVAAAEERLARLVITRETARQLLGDPESGAGPVAPPEPRDAAAPQTSGDAGMLSARDLDDLQAKLALLESRFGPRSFAPPPPVEQPARPAEASGRLEWAEGLEKILVLLATSGRVMRAREIAAAIGEDASLPSRVETTRGRCKKLVKDGRAIEVEPGAFQIAPQTVPADPAGEEMPVMG